MYHSIAVCLCIAVVLNPCDGESVTICKFYEDVSKAEKCEGPTTFIENNDVAKLPVSDYITKPDADVIIKMNIQEYFQHLDEKMRTLEAEIMEIQSKLSANHKSDHQYVDTPSTNINPSEKGIIYGNQRIKLPYTEGPGVDFGKAQNICKSLNASLAEITSDAMFDRVAEYIRRSWRRYSDNNVGLVRVWLGSTFQPFNNPENLITLTNSTRVRVDRWGGGFPYKGLNRVHRIHLMVKIRTSSGSNSGLRNVRDIKKNGVPLCASKI